MSPRLILLFTKSGLLSSLFEIIIYKIHENIAHSLPFVIYDFPEGFVALTSRSRDIP
jgi:hypothetical protein